MLTETGTSNYTHQHCGECGALLYCSEAEPWEPQTDYGWCPHIAEDEMPLAVWTEPPTADCWHNCQGREGASEQ